MSVRAVLLASLIAPALAAADVPPPPDYVEQCTVAKQCKKDEEGLTCGASYGERDKCEKTYAKDGWTARCKTRGATVWTEVWCRPKRAKK